MDELRNTHIRMRLRAQILEEGNYIELNWWVLWIGELVSFKSMKGGKFPFNYPGLLVNVIMQ